MIKKKIFKLFSKSKAMFNLPKAAGSALLVLFFKSSATLGISKITFSWFCFYFVFPRPWIVSHPAWKVRFFWRGGGRKKKNPFFKENTPILNLSEENDLMPIELPRHLGKKVFFSPGGIVVYFDLCPWHVLKVKKMFNVFLLLKLRETLPQTWLFNVWHSLKINRKLELKEQVSVFASSIRCRVAANAYSILFGEIEAVLEAGMMWG